MIKHNLEIMLECDKVGVWVHSQKGPSQEHDNIVMYSIFYQKFSRDVTYFTETNLYIWKEFNERDNIIAWDAHDKDWWLLLAEGVIVVLETLY